MTVSFFNDLLYSHITSLPEFIVQNGLECVTQSINAVKNCVIKIVNIYYGSIQTNDFLIIDEENCFIINSLEICLVDVLSKCKGKEAAKLVRAVFQSARMATICKHFTQKNISDSNMDQKEASGRVTAFAAILFLIIGVVLISVVCFYKNRQFFMSN